MGVEGLRDSALENIKDLIDGLANAGTEADEKKAELISYWLSDYARLIRQEKVFQPNSRMKYKRGQIVKAHLGFRIGNEEGGLHYGIVLDKNNSIKAGTLTIVPLTSVKPEKAVHWTSVPLGEEIYDLLSVKLEQYILDLKSKNDDLNRHFENIKEQFHNREHLSGKQRQGLGEELKSLRQTAEKIIVRISAQDKVKRELLKMKKGSIALVGQIVTISKLRIYDPISSEDSLGSVRVSEETLDQIDKMVSRLFIGDSFQKERNF